MATAGVSRMMLWTDLEDRELLGRWRLGRLVRPEGRTAWFLATGSDGEPLMLSITEALNDEDELLARLRAAAEIHHPHVVAVREACMTLVDDTPVVVAAMEPIEENLGDVLRERSLSVAEAQQVLEALVKGLAAIHAQGLVHGRMEPASVLATGETIKLRSDCLHPAAGSAAAFEDVRGVGRIVTQAVTRRIPAGGNDAVLQLLPEPMARAVRRALSGNATIEEIAGSLGLPIAAEPVKGQKNLGAGAGPEAGASEIRAPGPVVVPRPTPVTHSVAEGSAVESAAAQNVSRIPEKESEKPEMPMSQPQRAGEPVAASAKAGSMSALPGKPQLSPVQTQDEEPAWRHRRSAPWVMGAALLVVLATVCALYGVLHRRTTTVQKTIAAPPAVQRGGGAQPSTAVAPQNAVRTKGAGVVALSTPGWRVIAYTYRHEAQAEHKAQVLAQSNPRLTPGVFALHGQAPYLVTLGGVMSTKADALALREEAVRMGLPRDTYVQNYH
jgi:hypothetical protein